MDTESLQLAADLSGVQLRNQAVVLITSQSQLVPARVDMLVG